jgi:hypothetical protein
MFLATYTRSSLVPIHPIKNSRNRLCIGSIYIVCYFNTSNLLYTKMRSKVPARLIEHILNRQRHKCNMCCVFLDVYDIDHIVPYRIHSVHTLKNLQALCPTCHARKTRKEAKDLALYVQCEKTQSQRYCWTCKRVVSAYFDCCSNSLNTSFQNMSLHGK